VCSRPIGDQIQPVYVRKVADVLAIFVGVESRGDVSV
jgi:hypothetical protein